MCSSMIFLCHKKLKAAHNMYHPRSAFITSQYLHVFTLFVAVMCGYPAVILLESFPVLAGRAYIFGHFGIVLRVALSTICVFLASVYTSTSFTFYYSCDILFCRRIKARMAWNSYISTEHIYFLLGYNL